MRILLVDDEDTFLPLVQHQLYEAYDFEVEYVSSPELAAQAISRSFDVIVVDVLFGPVTRAFDRQRRAGKVTLNTRPLLRSGLHVIHHARRSRVNAQIVIWTNGESNRQLHMMLAKQDQRLAVHSFCAKTGGKSGTRKLVQAIRAAADGVRFVDEDLVPYFPSDQANCRSVIWEERVAAFLAGFGIRGTEPQRVKPVVALCEQVYTK